MKAVQMDFYFKIVPKKCRKKVQPNNLPQPCNFSFSPKCMQRGCIHQPKATACLGFLTAAQGQRRQLTARVTRSAWGALMSEISVRKLKLKLELWSHRNERQRNRWVACWLCVWIKQDYCKLSLIWRSWSWVGIVKYVQNKSLVDPSFSTFLFQSWTVWV